MKDFTLNVYVWRGYEWNGTEDVIYNEIFLG